LIICDKSFAEKANKGEPGGETMVISAELYGKVKPDKFIPIIFERDKNGKEYSPLYLKTHIFIDLSDSEQYEENYEKLLRFLYNKPVYSEPPLGGMPEWLNEEDVSLSRIRIAVKQIQAYDGKNTAKLEFLIRRINDDFINTLIESAPAQDTDFNYNILHRIDAMKPLRDLCLDYIKVLFSVGSDVGTIIGDLFEQMYNGMYNPNMKTPYNKRDFEYAKFVIWELFICTTAIMLYYEKYRDLNRLLYRTYFLRENSFNQDVEPRTFSKFRFTLNNYIDEHIKPTCENPNLYTLAGDITMKRGKTPIINRQSLVNADLVLYQLSCIYSYSSDMCHLVWFPMLYVYGEEQHSYKQLIWSKMVSQKHCRKLFSLFEAAELEQLREMIKKNKPDREVRYPRSSEQAASIQQSIEYNKIGITL
jgi:hypothetical protein